MPLPDITGAPMEIAPAPCRLRYRVHASLTAASRTELSERGESDMVPTPSNQPATNAAPRNSPTSCQLSNACSFAVFQRRMNCIAPMNIGNQEDGIVPVTVTVLVAGSNETIIPSCEVVQA